MKVFLTGFMGSGKSTIGKKLASYLKCDFIDLDKLIESRAGMSIVDYFSAFGETAFRNFEREVLQSTDYPDPVVIATGGGAPCYHDNMEWMNANGLVAYLSLSPRGLASRLQNSTADRPLIRGLKGEELVEFITGKLAAREEHYQKAKFVVSANDLTAERLAFYLGLNH